MSMRKCLKRIVMGCCVGRVQVCLDPRLEDLLYLLISGGRSKGLRLISVLIRVLTKDSDLEAVNLREMPSADSRLLPM